VQPDTSERAREGKAGAHAARPAGHAVPQSLFYIVKFGFDGERTESNHRLI